MVKNVRTTGEIARKPLPPISMLNEGIDKTPNAEWRNGGMAEPECDGTGMRRYEAE